MRSVLETMVHFGAPPRILLDGSPHLGTDNLVRMLKRFRAELLDLGAKIRWDSRFGYTYTRCTSPAGWGSDEHE